VEIPVDWDLGVLDLGPRSGFVRLDDEFEPRLLLRWQPIKGDFDPERAMSAYFRDISRKRRSPHDACKTGVKIPGLSQATSGMSWETFSTRTAHFCTTGFAACCPQCQRAFVAEMRHSGEGRGEEKRLVGKVLGSLRDHPGGELSRWEVFGLSTDLPANLRALAHTFNQGFISYVAGTTGERLLLARWSLADIHLAAASLSDFAKQYLLKHAHRAIAVSQQATIQGHEAYIFHTKSRITDGLAPTLCRICPARIPPHAAAAFWHCPTSNRVMMLIHYSARPADVGTLRLHTSRVRCCKVTA
jgi:hypothetical protein